MKIRAYSFRKFWLRSFYLFSVTLIMAFPVNLSGQSSRDFVVNYYSSALEKETNYRIFLPPGYNASDDDTRYPVVYLLHGAGSGYESFDLLLPLVDAFWSNNYIRPFIMVMPDGTSPPFKGSFYTNSELYGNYEDVIWQDLIPLIDENYNTIARNSFRGIWGFSMGAYGGFKQLFKHPEYYAGIAAHSGPVNLELLDNLIPDLKAEQGGQPPYDWKYEPGKGLTNLMVSMAGAFSPNPLSETLVDFPLDDQGNIIPGVMDRWKPHNISQLASDLPGNFRMPIYFDCGNLDEYKLIHHNRALSDTLTKYGIQHEFQEYTGDHTSGLIFRIPLALEFFDELFDSVIINTDNLVLQDKDKLIIYPNPAESHINVYWENSRIDEALLRIIDLTGRVVYEGLVRPNNEMRIETGEYGPGLYLLTIETGQGNLRSGIIIR